MGIDNNLFAALAALFGALIGGGMGLIGQWINARMAEKKALREFAVKTAIENWRHIAERADALAMPRHEYGPSPMDGYLIRTMVLVELLQKRTITPSDVESRLRDMDGIGRVLNEHLQKKRNQ